MTKISFDRPILKSDVAVIRMPSKSNPKMSHEVRFLASCSCRGFSFRGWCSHIDQVADLIKNRGV